MHINFLKTFFFKLSTLVESINKSFENEEVKASAHPLYQSFNLYAKEDLKLALDCIKNGYAPTKLQQNNLNAALIKDSINNNNFLYHYQTYLNYVPQEAIISFCIHKDLSHSCQNEKTIFHNFKHLLKNLCNNEQFSENLYSQLNSSIFNNALKCINIKPKYANVHAFEFTKEESILFSRFTANIYNALVLIPYMVKNIDQIVSLRTTIEQSVEKIEKHVQSHNIRINDDGKIIHFNKHNRQAFQVDVLNRWVKYIREYDTKKLQSSLMEKIKKSQSVDNNLKNTVLEMVNPSKSKLNESNKLVQNKINEIKPSINIEQQQQIERIEILYDNIKSEIFESIHHNELDSLYKDLPHVIEKFISIHPDYRESLKNIEGKSPEQLMIDSLTMIESKFKLYWEEINQNKVTDLSIVERRIKMKS